MTYLELVKFHLHETLISLFYVVMKLAMWQLIKCLLCNSFASMCTIF